MLDGEGREINYLRISVTDRCNLRCRYCMPEDGVSHFSPNEILSWEEFARLVKVAAALGITKVRLTGGEPLVRRNIIQLFHYIKEIPTIDDVAITTNGTLFAPMAAELKAAGLRRVNFSLDSLVAEKYSFITRQGKLAVVLGSIARALELELDPVKINMVVIRGFNDNEIIDFVKLAEAYPLHVRFIECMPVGGLSFWHQDGVMSGREIKERIERDYPLEAAFRINGNGPASYYRIPGGKGSIGFITPLSNHFCQRCNRIRLTAEGKLRTCLYEQGEFDLRAVLRRGGDDEELRRLFLTALASKPRRHNMESGWGEENRRKMFQIGG